MRFSILPLALMVLPLLEIAVFIIVGRYIGVLPVIGLIFLSSAIGGVLLRIQGIGVLRKLSRELDAGRLPARELIHGAMIVLAGLFLLTPGFVTDILGLLLFIPAVRDAAWLLIKDRIVVSGVFRTASRGPASPFDNGNQGDPEGDVIDLDAEDYHRERNPNSPWNRRID
ncbi:MAG TPA: FxsA family protein [Ensifer sp.]|nr:FxsA family protein [Ensifer sp.]